MTVTGSSTSATPVYVVGAGMSGASCARVLADRGVPVVVLDRGFRAGGRAGVRTEQFAGQPRPTDIGAYQLTARNELFAARVQQWQRDGFLRPWRTAAATGSELVTWASTRGMRALVDDELSGIDHRAHHEVDTVDAPPDGGAPSVNGMPAAAVVLAMPDPQACDLLSPALATRLQIQDTEYDPTLVLWATWPQRWWTRFSKHDVETSEVLTVLFDDGDRRDDDVAMVVAHSTPQFAAEHLDDPQAARTPMLLVVEHLLGARITEVPTPELATVHRWSLAQPLQVHPAPFALLPELIGVCSDSWGGDHPDLEQAWLSGHRLGQELADRLLA